MLKYVAMAAMSVAGKTCNLKEHMKYDLTRCEGPDSLTSVFFFYPKEADCDPNESEKLPPLLQSVPCSHLCSAGEYTTFELVPDSEPRLTCQKCPSDSIAVSGGFIYQATMETHKMFPHPDNRDLAHFKASCVSVDETNPRSGGFSSRLDTSCVSWRPTGTSLIA